MKKTLLNETALITGSTSGIGKKIAEFLVDHGCKVAICSRNQENVTKTLDEFQKKYGTEMVYGSVCDVSDFNSLKSFTEKAINKFGSLRIVIANAGINSRYGPLTHYPLDSVYADAHKIINVNLLGAINTVSIALHYMKQQHYGRIITLTGGGASRPLANMTFYSASKGGVAAFSRCIAEELNESTDDIKINIFQPGMLKTNLEKNTQVLSTWKSEEEFQPESDLVHEYLGGDIEKSIQKILPYVSSSCSKNGTEFRGYPLIRLIINAIKLQKQLKKLKY